MEKVIPCGLVYPWDIHGLVAVKGELTGDLFVFTSSYQVRSNQIKVGRSAYSIIHNGADQRDRG